MIINYDMFQNPEIIQEYKNIFYKGAQANPEYIVDSILNMLVDAC